MMEINPMKHYDHYVSGFFAHRNDADDVVTKLVAGGLSRKHLQIYSSEAPEHFSAEGSNQILRQVLVAGAIGTVVGIVIGALIEVALVASNANLFVASPLIAPLALLGWGASLGGLIGACIGAAQNTRSLSKLIDDAILEGQIVVIAKTKTDSERAIAQGIIKNSIGDYHDVKVDR
jgi:hypothetical protein